jgi:predicted alpha/beta hydrolase family esterase
MNSLILVPGKPTRERYENPKEPKPHKANWFPWIANEAGKVGICASIAVMPRPYYPVYDAWKSVLESLGPIDENTGFVGHSAGAELQARWLSENKDVRVGRVVWVAPYRDKTGKYGDFSRYVLDAKLTERVGRLTIFNSTDDDPQIQEYAHELVGALPAARLVEFEGYGHFRIGHNMSSPEFPELLQELVG